MLRPLRRVRLERQQIRGAEPVRDQPVERQAEANDVAARERGSGVEPAKDQRRLARGKADNVV